VISRVIILQTQVAVTNVKIRYTAKGAKHSGSRSLTAAKVEEEKMTGRHKKMRRTVTIL